MLDEAKATRERVLADLSARRALLQAQIDELRAGRDNLLDAYRVVKRTFLEATEALAQVEARAAAERIARTGDAHPTDELADELADQVAVDEAAAPETDEAATEHANGSTPVTHQRRRADRRCRGRRHRRGRSGRRRSRRRRLAVRRASAPATTEPATETAPAAAPARRAAATPAANVEPEAAPEPGAGADGRSRPAAPESTDAAEPAAEPAPDADAAA